MEVIPIAQIEVDTKSSVALMSCNACSKVWDATGIKLRFGIGSMPKPSLRESFHIYDA